MALTPDKYPLEYILNHLEKISAKIDRSLSDLRSEYDELRTRGRSVKKKRGTFAHKAADQSNSAKNVQFVLAEKHKEVKQLLKETEDARKSVCADIPLQEMLGVISALRASNDAKIGTLHTFLRSSKSGGASFDSGSVRKFETRDAKVLDSGESHLHYMKMPEAGNVSTFGGDNTSVTPSILDLQHVKPAMYPVLELPKPFPNSARSDSFHSRFSKACDENLLAKTSELCKIPTIEDCGLSDEALAILQPSASALYPFEN